MTPEEREGIRVYEQQKAEIDRRNKDKAFNLKIQSDIEELGHHIEINKISIDVNTEWLKKVQDYINKDRANKVYKEEIEPIKSFLDRILGR